MKSGDIMEKVLLIINPAAGKKKAGKNLAEIIGVFNRAKMDTRVYITQCEGDATRAVKKLGKGMDLIVCCGGDGTFNETVSGVIKEGLDVQIGYIPAGSTNDFARTLGLPTDMVECAKNIVHGKAKKYDIGRFDHKYFCYVASFGAFTNVSYDTPQNVKNSLGHLAYLLESIKALSQIKSEHIKLKIDEEELEDEFIFGAICNSTSLGGVLTLNPDVVDMRDGLFELLLIRMPKNLVELHECIVALQKQSYDSSIITFKKAKKITVFANKDVNWSLDGEKAQGKRKTEIENLHKKIKLLG